MSARAHRRVLRSGARAPLRSTRTPGTRDEPPAAFRRILVALDGSNSSKRALDVALDMTAAFGARLEMLAVEGPLPRAAATVGEVEDSLHEREAIARDLLLMAGAAARMRGVEAATSMRPGPPVEVIVRRADEIGADLIVVGHRDHPVYDFLHGSAALRVTRSARCAVLVVR